MQKPEISARTNKGYDIFHDLTIDSQPDEVYNAVTQPRHLINWWPLKCSGTAALGEVYNFQFGAEYDWLGEVIECIENKSFHIKMTKSDPDWDATSIGFDIEAGDGNALLKFWHIDWPSCNDHFRRSSFCWALLLDALKNYIEKGTVIPFNERQ